MLSLKTILAPVDFSQRTDFEARNAADIARHFGSRLILLHVIPSFAEAPPADPAAAAAYSHKFSADVEKGIDDALKALVGRVAEGLEVECVVLSGIASDKIEEFAKGRSIDLVAMPTAESGRVRRHLFGSAVTKILHDLNCPVLTGAPSPSDKPDRKALYQKIACTVEPGELLPERLHWARDFAAAYDASLIVVGILPFLDGLGAPPSTPEPLREKALADAREEIQSFCKQEGTEAEISMLGGPIDEVLPSFVAANKIDLLVSSRGRYQERIGFFGFHTDVVDTAKSVPCPMVLV